MANKLSFDAILTQKSVFPKPLPLNVLLGDSLHYGTYEGMHLAREKVGSMGFVAYHPEHIGRGIRVAWTKTETKSITISLPLPSSDEEINDFIDMILRVSKAWTCSISFNDTILTSQILKGMTEDFEITNLRLLHDLMQDVLNQDSEGELSLSCAMHRIVVGKKEANQFWAGTTTDKFRDWMHHLQERNAFVAEVELLMNKDQRTYTGRFTLPSHLPIIFPNHPVLPLPYFDLTTGESYYHVTQWEVRLLDTDENFTYGYLSFDELQKRIPSEKVHYFDAANFYVDPLTREDFAQMMNEYS